MAIHRASPAIAPHRAATQLASLLAVLAMMVQAFVPLGYMVRGDAHSGGIAITLCTPNGSIAAFMAPDGQISASGDGDQVPNDHGQADQALCSFAAHSGASLATVAPRLTVPKAFLTPINKAPRAVHVAPSLALAAPPPPKTGPPSQA
jgi:hypothetical protein